MKRPTNEKELLDQQPIDKIDKNLRHIFGLLIEKDWKMASTLIDLMKKGNETSQQLAGGFTELVDFLKVFAAGKEMKAAMRGLDSILLDNEIDELLPENDNLEELRADIANEGILAPLVVQETSGGLKLIDGYTRYRIAQELNIRRVPVVSVNPMLEPKMVALTLNIIRRHMTAEQRQELIKKFPAPKIGRPRKECKIEKGDIVSLSKSKLAKSLGVHERTIQRDRNPKVKKEKAEQFQWINQKDLDIFSKVGYLKGIGYYFDFTKDQIDLDLLVRQVDTGMQQLLKAIKDAGLESQVEYYRMNVTFEARKKGVENV